MLHKKERIMPAVLLIYLLCFLFRIVEYFVLRTDQTVLGEAFVHKLIGIGILLFAAKRYRFRREEIGFSQGNAFANLLKGLVFGIFIFAAAYSIEILFAVAQGNFETLAVYVSAYSVDGNIGNQTALTFFGICIIGNLINVIMEEGIFRGLFPALLKKKYAFLATAILASSLFGIWHVAAPIRSYYDGVMSLGGMAANMVLLVVSSGLVGFKFTLMTKLTGSLYMAMGDHFVNNTIVNMLHVITRTGADELMAARIAIAQSVSFGIVLIWYMLAKRKETYAGKMESGEHLFDY